MARLLVMYGATYPAEATLDPRVQAAVRRWAPESGLTPEWINTHDDLQTYADELEKRWLGIEPVIIVEQDKEPHGACFPSLLACGEPWCSYTFWQNPVPHTTLTLGGFGVTKFSPWVQRVIPVSAFRGEIQVGIDRRFSDLLIAEHSTGCCLHGHVTHHHVYEPRPPRVREHAAWARAQGLADPAAYPEPADPGLLPGSYRLAE